MARWRAANIFAGKDARNTLKRKISRAFLRCTQSVHIVNFISLFAIVLDTRLEKL